MGIHDDLVDDSNMAASKLEINFRRLLERCEAMAEEIQDDKENVNWRLEKVGSSGDTFTLSTADWGLLTWRAVEYHLVTLLGFEAPI